MKLIHCRSCWQPMSPWKIRCPRCGDIDKYRRRRATVKLLIFLAISAIAVGILLQVR